MAVVVPIDEWLANAKVLCVHVDAFDDFKVPRPIASPEIECSIDIRTCSDNEIKVAVFVEIDQPAIASALVRAEHIQHGARGRKIACTIVEEDSTAQVRVCDQIEVTVAIDIAGRKVARFDSGAVNA